MVFSFIKTKLTDRKSKIFVLIDEILDQFRVKCLGVYRAFFKNMTIAREIDITQILLKQLNTKKKIFEVKKKHTKPTWPNKSKKILKTRVATG